MLSFNRYLEAALEYNLGVNFIYTEETAAGVERLKNVLEVCFCLNVDFI